MFSKMALNIWFRKFESDFWRDYLQMTFLGVSFATNVTFIWFFSSVHSRMDIECTWRLPVTATYRTADWRFVKLISVFQRFLQLIIRVLFRYFPSALTFFMKTKSRFLGDHGIGVLVIGIHGTGVHRMGVHGMIAFHHFFEFYITWVQFKRYFLYLFINHRTIVLNFGKFQLHFWPWNFQRYDYNRFALEGINTFSWKNYFIEIAKLFFEINFIGYQASAGWPCFWSMTLDDEK